MQQGDERDLNGFHSSQGVTELHGSDRALDRRSRLDGTTDEYIAAASGKQEQREKQKGREEELHKSPRHCSIPLVVRPSLSPVSRPQIGTHFVRLSTATAFADSDEKLLRSPKSANVLHQSVDLVLTEASPERRHISSPFSDHASQLGIRLLLDLRRVKIRRM